jgi:2-C-methyl-D-erythritol 4-phosphate cytidylyltransferase/2-C-methyl-D-erythritol 2,4-cyclodiphosphate synthase
MEFSAVIVAAGKGERAGPGLAKQWREIGGKPVLRWSALALAKAGAKEIVVVIRPRDKALADAALEGIAGCRYADGAITRARSVASGLAALAPVDAVLIHDAARPFIPDGMIEKLLAALGRAEGAIPTLPVEDTLKKVLHTMVETVPREGLWRAQTPQAFRYETIKGAYDDIRRAALVTTDDAAVVEAYGRPVTQVQGDPRLMKLTFAEDFAMAQAIAASFG